MTIFKEGVVTAVLMSPNRGYPTHAQEEVEVEKFGIKGDRHSGPLRESFTRPGTMKPNDRPMLIIAAEEIMDMNNRFGLQMKPGSFNEQVDIDGMGDLRDLLPGDEFVFEGGVKLKFVESATPCAELAAYHQEPRLLDKGVLVWKEGDNVISRRGALTGVTREGVLRPGEKVVLQRV